MQGVWRLELTLDSASAIGPRPKQRNIPGQIAFAGFGGDSAYGWRAQSTDRFGRFDIDFTPFFGGRAASDVSTTIVAPLDRGLVTEALGELHSRDSVRIELIPRMSYGGLTLHMDLRVRLAVPTDPLFGPRGEIPIGRVQTLVGRLTAAAQSSASLST